VAAHWQSTSPPRRSARHAHRKRTEQTALTCIELVLLTTKGTYYRLAAGQRYVLPLPLWKVTLVYPVASQSITLRVPLVPWRRAEEERVQLLERDRLTIESSLRSPRYRDQLIPFRGPSWWSICTGPVHFRDTLRLLSAQVVSR
jgi:hypothetical protein